MNQTLVYQDTYCNHQSINQTPISPISPAKPGSVARHPNHPRYVLNLSSTVTFQTRKGNRWDCLFLILVFVGRWRPIIETNHQLMEVEKVKSSSLTWLQRWGQYQLILIVRWPHYGGSMDSLFSYQGLDISTVLKMGTRLNQLEFRTTIFGICVSRHLFKVQGMQEIRNHFMYAV